MQFSDTTDKLGIIQACERYTNLGDTGISGNAQLLKEFTAHSNKVLRKIWHIIFRSTGNWIYDDANQTDLPQAVTDLVSGTDTYALPAALLAVERIEIKNESGDWSILHPITLDDIKIAEGDFYDNQNGIPRRYRMVGQTIKLYPASNYNSTGGLKVFFQRGSVAFDSADTTETPGFASEYHDAVPLGASLEYMISKRPNDAVTTRLEREYMKYVGDDTQRVKGSIEQYYEMRNRDYKPVLRRKTRRYR